MKKFPVQIVENRKGYWIKFGTWSDEKYWDMVSEEDMVSVADWCREHECGTRMSYDMFEFKSQKDLEFFMLKWS